MAMSIAPPPHPVSGVENTAGRGKRLSLGFSSPSAEQMAGTIDAMAAQRRNRPNVI
jgi:hypothetical protein